MICIYPCVCVCDECGVVIIYLIEVVDVIQYLYARKATIVIKRL